MKRPMDIFRDSAGSFSIGNDEDGTAIQASSRPRRKIRRMGPRKASFLLGGLCHIKISVTLEPITSEQATNGLRRLLIPGRASKK
jgi:hypothetical protein